MVKRCSDQRRRRVVLGEVSGLADVNRSSREPGDAANPTGAYSASAQRRHHWKTSDLFPKRFWPCALVVLGLIAIIGFLNGLDWLVRQQSSLFDSSAWNALRIGKAGSLSAWFSSFLFVLSGLASIQIYALRRHRRDDYGGSYRLWLWMAALFLLGSINGVVDLESLASSLIRSRTSFHAAGASYLLVGIKFLLLTSLVVRGTFELRASRGAMVCVLCVWAAYSGAWALQLPAIQPHVVGNPQLYQGNLNLAGGAALFLTLIIYFRFIFLQAHGLIQLPAVRSDADEQSQGLKKRKADQGKTAKKTPSTKTETTNSSRGGTKSRKTMKSDTGKTDRGSTDASNAKSNKENGTSPLGSRLKLRSAKSSEQPGTQPSKPQATTDATSAMASELDPEIEKEILQLSQKTNLSKSERRRLRKLEKRHRRAA